MSPQKQSMCLIGGDVLSVPNIGMWDCKSVLCDWILMHNSESDVEYLESDMENEVDCESGDESAQDIDEEEGSEGGDEESSSDQEDSTCDLKSDEPGQWVLLSSRGDTKTHPGCMWYVTFHDKSDHVAPEIYSFLVKATITD